MTNKPYAGHIFALITIIIWGTTFISTKVLLTALTPAEILLLRFAAGFLALFIIQPKIIKTSSPKEELTFAAAGLCGICLYYLLENIALTYTRASNVGVIISAAPFFTAILSPIFIKTDEKPKIYFYIGFIAAMTGIALISFNGSQLRLSPKGDILALAAALVWAFYSILSKKIAAFKYPTISATRRTFFYGLLFMLPVFFLSPSTTTLSALADKTVILNLLYLSLGASALCFVTWNLAVKTLGAVKTSIYIYLIPVITTLTSAVILKEPITPLSAAGTLLTVAGLFLSEYKPKKEN